MVTATAVGGAGFDYRVDLFRAAAARISALNASSSI
jgi:hypothetical protein